jgi:dipeptidyl aminopeptidase/acylaminoacyl peptidase/CubicO group peptidase (beta-lactamase class C family)
VTRRQRIADLTTFALPEQPALSPDGREVVYVLATTDEATGETVRSLWRVATAGATGGTAGATGSTAEGTGSTGSTGSTARPLTRGRADAAPAWSPDGTSVAFLRGAVENAGDGPAQVWLLPMDGGEPGPLTTLPFGAGAPVWSPDGTKIAFSAPVDAEGLDLAARAKAPVVADRLDYQADGAGLIGAIRTHLHVLDVASREVRQVTSGDWHAGPPAWSPDSARLAFSAATAPDADLEYRAPVYVIEAARPGARPELAGLPAGTGGPLTWTADGTALLVAGMTGAPVGHAGLLRVPLMPAGASPAGASPAGAPAASRAAPHSAAIDSAAVNIAAALDRNVMPGGPGYPGGLPQLGAGGETVLFCVRDRGCTHLYSAPADGSGVPGPVIAGAGRVVSGLSVAGGRNTAVVVLATPASYGEVVAVDLTTGTETVLTDHGASHAAVTLFSRQEREFTISDGTTVHGWLVRDPAAGEPGPLLLDIHGGPHNAWNGAADPVHLYHQELAARGWTVLLLNPRASDGYGEAFFNGAIGRWGDVDAKDLLEPVDALVAEGIADPGRLAVTGYSYGGYMTCYLTSHDDRFAAAVPGGVATDLTSMAGTSDQGHALSAWELGGQWWAAGDRERFAAMSPLTHVDQVRTPTLILHGADDATCPAGQAQQWHTALRERGVPAQLVLYPGASHLFILSGPAAQRADWNQRVVDWVEEHAAGTPRPVDAAHWRRRLAALAERHNVPGAALGILRLRPGREDELVEAAYGLLNADAGVEATTDSVWQIGSISKVWTATLAMQLVDDGRLDLDAPVADYLPELELADADVAKTVTMRHLLTHTSGIDGDVFTDTGRGDECLERYVALLAEVRQNHPLGATWSYCNSGFSLAGRVIEKITGGTWDAALRQRICTPLGLARTVTLPEEALLFRTAVGHVDVTGQRHVAPVWTLPRSLGPAGLICSTPADVLAFARMHLAGGKAADGTQVLSAGAARAMTEHQADLPDKYVLGDSWGIGWIRFGWDGQRLVGHDGNTIGQAAFLRVLPDPEVAGAGLAVTLLTNGGNPRDLYQDLYAEIVAELAGVTMPAPIQPPAPPAQADITPHLGTYERASVRMEVEAGQDGPVLRTTVLGPLAELTPDPVSQYPMVAVAPDLFVVREPEAQTWIPVTFYSLATGEKYVHFGARATPKVS